MIAIFVYNVLEKHQNFIEAAQKQQVQLDVIPYSKLNFSFLNGSASITFEGKDLNQYQIIYLKVGDRKPELTNLIAEYCLSHNITVIDEAYTQQPWIGTKAFDYLKLTTNQIPVIDSLFITQDQIEQVSSTLGYPCVAKETFNSQGEGVYLAENQQELKEIFKKNNYQRLMIQKFVENEGDYRFFVIGSELIGAMKRIRTSSDTFKNNISLGGRAAAYQPTEAETKLAIKAAQTLKYNIAGVDLVKENGGMKIIELNRSPGYTGLQQVVKVDVPFKIVEYLKNCAASSKT